MAAAIKTRKEGY